MSNSFHLAIPAGDLKKAEAFYTNLPRERHDVDMGQVPVPHFGVHLKKDVFNKIKANIEANKINYIDKPYTRFEGTEFEQNTFFIEDPNGNVLELKTFD